MNDPGGSPARSPSRLRPARKLSDQAQRARERARKNDDDDDDEFATDKSRFAAPRNDGAVDAIVVLAHVKDKIIPVHCGFGTQQVQWLGHVAIARYDEQRHEGWRALGVPTQILRDGKDALRFTDLICDVLPTHSHVYLTTSLGG
ncbi:hypothetical protein P43SY_010033 [Pythium insidiosum]|uniref:Uncharacterized protein n=1 Tax=Pythium insidiosum TaxID=114742 RepID=A0AAD5Q4J3_PYTIN|nr:hypothetical protein P43SY_010033 [Pythium insidiosum]